MDEHADERPVWKVSRTLDRLDLLCEQHHLQTEHHDGLPDWASRSEPAGVASEAHVDVPANFAWLRDNSKSSWSGAGDNVLCKKEAQVLQAQPTAPLPSHFHDEKRHFERAGGEIADTANKTAHEDNELEAARKIEELRLETQKFMARLANINQFSPHSTSGGTVRSHLDGLEDSGGLANDSSQSELPASEDPALLATPEVTGKWHGDMPRRDHHLDSQQPDLRGSVSFRAPRTTSTLPVESSKRRSVLRFASAQPQASMFPIMESKKHRLESPGYEEQEPRAGPRGGYRTAYGDANAWIQPDAPLASADFFKARQVIDAAAGSGTTYERRYVLTAAQALRVAQRSAQEFLGENSQVPHVQSGASPDGVSSPADRCAASPASSRVTLRDEANQTELEIPDAMYQPSPKVETSCQTDTKCSSPAISLASSKDKMRKARGASPRQAPPTPASALDVSSRTANSTSSKTQSLHQNPKKNGARIHVPQHLRASSSNPVLMHPRYPPVPTIFRAKSTYTTEFGNVNSSSKKRIPAR